MPDRLPDYHPERHPAPDPARTPAYAAEAPRAPAQTLATDPRGLRQHVVHTLLVEPADGAAEGGGVGA